MSAHKKGRPGTSQPALFHSNLQVSLQVAIARLTNHRIFKHLQILLCKPDAYSPENFADNLLLAGPKPWPRSPSTTM
jgi:hypothetical protein